MCILVFRTFRMSEVHAALLGEDLGNLKGPFQPSDELGQSLGQAQNEAPEVSNGFIRLCCSNNPKLSDQGQPDPCWFSLTLETGKSELLLPRHCNAASWMPEYHQMTIDFLAGRLSCRQENCSLAWLHVVKKTKSVKCHLKTPVCLTDFTHTGYQRSLLPRAAVGICVGSV